MRYCMETFPRFVDVSTVKLVYAYLRGFACGHLALDTDNRARPDQSELDSLAEDCMQDHRYTRFVYFRATEQAGWHGVQSKRACE